MRIQLQRRIEPMDILTSDQAPTRSVAVLEGALPEWWQNQIANLEQSISSGFLKVLKVAPGSLEPRALSADAWREGEPLVKWKRLLLVANRTDDPIALKLFRPGSLPRRIFYRLPSVDPYRKAYRFHQQLAAAGIRTVGSIARGQLRERSGLLYAGFFAMERLDPGVVSLYDELDGFLDAHGRSAAAYQEVREHCAKGLALMHRKGFFHKDIKPYHCLVEPSDTSSPLGDPAAWIWLDLDRCALRTPLAPHERVTNLYHFWRYFLTPLGEEQLDDFVARYLRLTPDLQFSVEELSRLVRRHLERRLSRAARRGQTNKPVR